MDKSKKSSRQSGKTRAAKRLARQRSTQSPVVRIAQALSGFLAGTVIAGAILGTILGGIVQSIVRPVLHVVTTPQLPYESLTIVLGVLSLFIIALWLLLLQVSRQTEEVYKSIGIRIEYLDREADGVAAIYRKSREVVLKAQQQVRVLNSFIAEDTGDIEPGTGTLPDDLRRERDKYYDTLIGLAQNGIKYERLVQLKPDQTVQDLTKDDGYQTHFKRILEVKQKNPDLSIGLQKVPARRLSTFVLVDDAWVLWQINELLPPTNQMQIYGVFVIHDPSKAITQHFIDSFDQIRLDAGAVREGDL